jgi:hypothetical protein
MEDFYINLEGKKIKSEIEIFSKSEIDLGLKNKNMHAKKCNPIKLLFR